MSSEADCCWQVKQLASGLECVPVTSSAKLASPESCYLPTGIYQPWTAQQSQAAEQSTVGQLLEGRRFVFESRIPFADLVCFR